MPVIGDAKITELKNDSIIENLNPDFLQCAAVAKLFFDLEHLNLEFENNTTINLDDLISIEINFKADVIIFVFRMINQAENFDDPIFSLDMVCGELLIECLEKCILFDKKLDRKLHLDGIYYFRCFKAEYAINFRDIADSVILDSEKSNAFDSIKSFLVDSSSFFDKTINVFRKKSIFQKKAPDIKKIEFEDQFNQNDFENLLKTNFSVTNRALKRKLFTRGCVSTSTRQKSWKYLLQDDEDSQNIEQYKLVIQNFDSLTVEEISSDPRLSLIHSQICKDYLRTDRHISFYAKNNENLQTIKKLLLAYCTQDTEKGYTQGMNELIAIVYYLYHNESESAIQNEATTLFVFDAILSKIMDNIIYNLDTGLKIKFGEIMLILSVHDHDAFETLIKFKSDSFTFFTSWIILMFKRIYSDYENVMRLWDSLITGFNLAIAPEIKCHKLDSIICAILASLACRFSNEGCNIFESVEIFLEANSDLSNDFTLHPDRIMQLVTDFYHREYFKGSDGKLFTILFSI